MKSLILSGLFLLTLLVPSTLAAEEHGQPKFEVRPTMIRCLSQTDLAEGWKRQNMHIVISSVEEHDVIKAVAIDPENNVMVVVITPDDKACILDYMENAWVGVKPTEPPPKPTKEERS